MMKRYILIFSLFLGIFSNVIYGQSYGYGSSEYRARNDHDGNLIRITIANNGRLGTSRTETDSYSGEWPINSGHVQMGNVSLYVMSQLRVVKSIAEQETTYTYITPVVWCEGWDPNMFPHSTLKFQGFEPLPGFLNISQKERNPRRAVAMSHQAYTWPPYWPDKTGDTRDPGWRAHWNGYFGKDQFNADQESFYMMDDYQADRPSVSGGTPIPWPKPVASEPKRAGLGLRVAVRGLQWSNPDAEDCLFLLYDINNFGELNLDKTVFGLNVGASSGAISPGGGDWDDDAAEFYRELSLAVNHEDYRIDPNNPGTGGYAPVPWVGFAFLESPGNFYDGIDNDGDGNDPRKPGGATGKIIRASDFWKSYRVGDTVIMIDYNSPYYTRYKTVMPSEGITFKRGDYARTFMPNTMLYEIPHNGIDDNLNGLVDESDSAIDQDSIPFYLYIRSAKNNRDYRAKDFFTGDGLNNLLIDERRDDGLDNDGDWDLTNDDVGLDGKPGTADEGEGDGLPTAGIGELPGEPNIDRVDVSESDQIGLTSFKFYEYGTLQYDNEAQMWAYSVPGYFDNKTTKLGDFDYVFSSGYFPLRSKQREFYSMALVYGIDEADIIRNTKVVQEIYDANYNFAIAPLKPIVRAIPGDRQVTLIWDDRAEMSFDRYLKEYDFEGYKIYKSTYSDFSDAGTITDGLGYERFKKPIAIYDRIDGVYGYFPKDFGKGVLFNLGNETGLVHEFVDRDVVNGQRYFYAVTAYDKGNLAKNIGPSETSIYVSVDASGNIQFSENVVAVTPQAPSLGYIKPGFDIVPTRIGNVISQGTVGVNILEPEAINNGDEFEIQFMDQTMDRVDNDLNGLIDSIDPNEWLPTLTSGFVLKNLSSGVNDTVYIYENRKIQIKDSAGNTQDTVINIVNLYDDDDKDPRTFTKVLRGMRISVYNPAPSLVHDTTMDIINGIHWGNGLKVATSYNVSFGIFEKLGYVSGTPFPRQYKIVFDDNIVDTSAAIYVYRKIPQGVVRVTVPRARARFKIYDIQTNQKIEFGYGDQRKPGPGSAIGLFSAGDEIIFFERLPNDSILITYNLRNISINDSVFYNLNGRMLGTGDTLYIYTDNPFNSGTKFIFKVKGHYVNEEIAKNSLSRIKVVPNPYVVTATWEPRNPYRSGRGPRLIQFINLPPRCTIRIYTIDGTLVKTLEHDKSIVDGSEQWDLMSKDNMSISYGVYIYHVDAPGIGQHVGKIFIIK